MPLGFVVMIVAFVLDCIYNDMSVFFYSLLNPFSLVFLGIGLTGMLWLFFLLSWILVMKSNWIEQLCNVFSRLSLFIGFLLAFY